MFDADNRHTAVLLREAVDALVIDPGGLYVDATFGRGGHSRGILDHLGEQGGLLAVDRDPEAAAAAQPAFARDPRFRFLQAPFSELSGVLEERGMMGRVNGMLLDLGVSSPQLDEGARGFSFSRGGPLDMRMDPSAGASAADWINSAPVEDIARVLKKYGEERYARRIAKGIARARSGDSIRQSDQLARIIAEAHPAWEPGKHPATRSFLGIRLYINGELEELEALLEGVTDILAPRGRLAVISFHSLEDRMVKRFIRRESKGPQLPRGLPLTEDQLPRSMKSLGKPVRPGADELAQNPRARSAIMRVAERLDAGRP